MHNYRVTVAEDERCRVIGFYALAGADDRDAELEFFFVEPDAMGRGVGRALFDHLEDTARRTGFTRFRIDADPNAAPFYERMGAVLIGQTRSRSIPGRRLPIYRFIVPPEATVGTGTAER